MQENLEFVCNCTGGTIIQGNQNQIISAVTTDSRSVPKGSLFVALKGDRFDGHDFVHQALEKGAEAAIVSKPYATDISNKAIIQVDDTLQALQDLAAAYRLRFDIPIIAVTGSVGKTTTRELIACCLATTWNTLKTKANYNNDIGLPLTLLQLEGYHQAAVVEMAMRGLGEIARLTKIARPNFALISNVEPVHLETMGSIENIARAKCEVLSQLPADGFVLINGDNELLLKEAEKYPCQRYTFGFNRDCDFQALSCNIVSSGTEIKMRFRDHIETIFFPLPAVKLALNAVSAAALASLLGIDMARIKQGLLNYYPIGYRLHIIDLTDGGKVINDAYNANPVSMAAALETGRQLAQSGKYAAILGEMYELGNLEVEGHINVGKNAYAAGVDLLVAVGERSRYIAQGAIQAGMDSNRVHYFSTKNEATNYLSQKIDNSWTLLFKASRGMQLEEIVDTLFEKGYLSAKRQ